MNRGLAIWCVLALCLMGATGAVLERVRGHQVLGSPGVKTHPLTGSIRLEAELPEHVLDYDSQSMETEEVAVKSLPDDTSFGRRRYRAPDNFGLDLRVVLMGRDRTSLHKPQFCLTGQGWEIDEVASSQTALRIQRPFAYDLPVVALVAHHKVSVDGQEQVLSGIYVYWYVADDALSASTSGFQRMYKMASRLLRTGVLQRWAYVSCFAPCLPGQENAAFNRVKTFIEAAVPQFQLYPRPNSLTLSSTP